MSFASGWLFGASAAAIAGAIKEQADQQKVKAALDWRWYQPVTPELPIARSEACEDVLIIGVPEGWRDLTDEELAQVSAAMNGRALFGVCTDAPDPRFGSSLTHFTVVDAGSAGPDAQLLFAAIDRLVQERARRLGLSSHGVPWKIGLGGERAFVHHMAGSAPGEGFGVDHPIALMYAEIFVVHRETVYAGAFQSPTETYQTYLPHLWTMLGNWSWFTQPPSRGPVGSSAPAPAPPPPGWHPDPSGEARWRYWDGSQWTAHTAD